MKKNILFFYCLLVVAVVSLKAQEIRPMPADSWNQRQYRAFFAE